MTPRSPRKQNNGLGCFLFLLFVIAVGFWFVHTPEFQNFLQNQNNEPVATAPQPTADVSNPQALLIASFNIRIFSNKSRNDEELKDIVSILKNYDLIGIQELRDEEVLERTVRMLKEEGQDFDYEISSPVGRGVKELYAFLYRKNKVHVLKHGKVFRDVQNEFIREPFYASFKAGDFDFTLITVHILYGKSKENRRPEIEALSHVYQSVQDEDPKEHDIILMGDFNMSPDDPAFNALKHLPTMTYLIVPPAKTTITDTSLYDNFWFERQFVHEYDGHSGINRFDETMFHNDKEKAKMAVSDHRLIWSEYDLRGGDDD